MIASLPLLLLRVAPAAPCGACALLPLWPSPCHAALGCATGHHLRAALCCACALLQVRYVVDLLREQPGAEDKDVIGAALCAKAKDLQASEQAL